VSVFAGYSRYYDLLYRDKDYAGEADYIAQLIRSFSPDARTVMEIGCGTGAHAAELAEIGYEVSGVDMSEGMLEAAESRRSSLPGDLASRLEFSHGDARSVRLGRKFDVVISLFHVMSYQTSNADLADAFATAREHVKPGGAFIFDCWYGPAVLKQWPAVTEKHLSDDSTEVHRTATPEIHVNENIVDVNYTVVVKDKSTDVSETLRETHRMRYLFTPEVELALNVAAMKLIDSKAWMKDTAPDVDTWAAVFVGRG